MVMSHEERRFPRIQNNYGSGPFVGRDNYGNIEMVDAKTKAVLAKLSQDAPALATLLDEALRDGVISPDTAIALSDAARSINEDVANALWSASERINFDVADLLNFAADRINPTVASQISSASEQMSGTTSQLENLVRRLDEVSGVVTSTAAADWERAASAVQTAAHDMTVAAQSVDTTGDGWSWKSFRWGFGVCLVMLLGLLGLWAYILHRQVPVH